MHATEVRSLPKIGLALAIILSAVLALKASPAFAAAPTITSVTPNSGPTTGSTSVTITGTGLLGVTAVTFGGTPASGFTVNNPTQITATSPAHAAGLVNIVVTHPTEGSNTDTVNDDFTYTTVGIPTVTSVAPATCTTAGGTTVTVTGTNFTGATVVSFGAASVAPSNVTATTLNAVCPAQASAGVVSVRVTNGSGTSADTPADDFTYTVGAPVVTAILPTGGPVTGGTIVTVTGAGFTGVTAVTFGGVPGTGIAVNGPGTEVTVTSPAHAAGTVDVLVIGPGGTSTNTAADNFTYGTVPTIISVTPTGGPVTGGTVVVISGSSLSGATSVTFGGVNATTFSVDNAAQITATAPAHAAGTVDIVVTTPLGINTNTAADNFTYSAGPFISSVSPTGGPTTGGTSVVITGTGFTGVTSVTFGGTAATTFTVNTNTQITVTAPAHAAGTVDIVVTSPAGTSPNTTADNYVYGAGPNITAISPATGPTTGGTVITITGTGFTGATAVTFDTTNVTPTTVTDTSIVVTSPAHASGVVNLRVVTPLGTSPDTAADNFTYGSGTTTTSFTLYFRWTLIVWGGKDGASVDASLKGQETPDNTATNNVSGVVTAIFHYNNPLQKFEGYFPGSAGIPGANDFTTFAKGQPYWIAMSQTGSLTWTVLAD